MHPRSRPRTRSPLQCLYPVSPLVNVTPFLLKPLTRALPERPRTALPEILSGDLTRRTSRTHSRSFTHHRSSLLVDRTCTQTHHSTRHHPRHLLPNRPLPARAPFLLWRLLILIPPNSSPACIFLFRASYLLSRRRSNLIIEPDDPYEHHPTPSHSIRSPAQLPSPLTLITPTRARQTPPPKIERTSLLLLVTRKSLNPSPTTPSRTHYPSLADLLNPNKKITTTSFCVSASILAPFNETHADEQLEQYYQQESAKMRHQIQLLQNANRHLMGDGLSSLTLKELKQLENRLERGITRIRSKKHELLFAEIEYMQKREVDLQNDNMYLRAKIADNERAQQANIVQAGADFETLPTFDSRNYYHVNILEAATHYSHHQDQTALHLGYETKADPSA